MDSIGYLLLAIIAVCLTVLTVIAYDNYVKNKGVNQNDGQTKEMDASQSTKSANTSDNRVKKSSANEKKKTDSARRTTKKMKWRDKMLDISMIPSTVELDRQTLLPKKINRKYGFGRQFNTFVVESDYTLYHRSTCTQIKNSKKKLVHRYIAVCKTTPCPHCNPLNFIDDWYMNFLNVNFKKFTSYADFQEWAQLPNVSLPNGNKYLQLSLDDDFLETT